MTFNIERSPRNFIVRSEGSRISLIGCPHAYSTVTQHSYCIQIILHTVELYGCSALHMPRPTATCDSHGESKPPINIMLHGNDSNGQPDNLYWLFVYVLLLANIAYLVAPRSCLLELAPLDFVPLLINQNSTVKKVH